MVVRLLYRRIAGSACANGGARLRVAVVVKMLRQAKVYQHSVAVPAQHHVAGLKVEVEHVVRVHIRQSLAYLAHVVQALVCAKPMLPVNQVAEAAAVDVFHGIVDGVVCLERLQHTHDALMVKIA